MSSEGVASSDPSGQRFLRPREILPPMQTSLENSQSHSTVSYQRYLNLVSLRIHGNKNTQVYQILSVTKPLVYHEPCHEPYHEASAESCRVSVSTTPRRLRRIHPHGGSELRCKAHPNHTVKAQEAQMPCVQSHGQCDSICNMHAYCA